MKKRFLGRFVTMDETYEILTYAIHEIAVKIVDKSQL